MDDRVTGRLGGLLDALAAQPGDGKLRERAALALDREGRHAEAAGLLVAGLINVAAHEPAMLPCLCARCLDPGAARVQAEGRGYQRSFVVVERRVLFFWLPDDPGLDLRVARRSVGAALLARLKQSPRSRKRAAP